MADYRYRTTIAPVDGLTWSFADDDQMKAFDLARSSVRAAGDGALAVIERLVLPEAEHHEPAVVAVLRNHGGHSVKLRGATD
ncbi:MAG TPA: hypothetical protein VKA48_01860 [Gammaproteobacteria bacterium]|nr:hypothetical protein [Gammaproteobacteria bacterium]